MKDRTKQTICSRCGVPTDARIDDIYICDECYAIRCSCCPEFGPDDLTQEATDTSANETSTD